jgi:uncharacterized protein YdhG (YjbR/CyaY superfamily)
MTSRNESGSAPAAEIDAYLASLPTDMRIALEALREAIRDAAPGAIEAISYGAPAFRYRGRPLVAYRAAKAHYAFYPMDPAVLAAHHEELASYDTSKGTLRLGPAEPLPRTLIAKLVRARVAQADARADG